MTQNEEVSAPTDAVSEDGGEAGYNLIVLISPGVSRTDVSHFDPHARCQRRIRLHVEGKKECEHCSRASFPLTTAYVKRAVMASHDLCADPQA